MSIDGLLSDTRRVGTPRPISGLPTLSGLRTGGYSALPVLPGALLQGTQARQSPPRDP